MTGKLRCKILSLLMVAVLCIGLLPSSVLGAEDAIVYVAAGDSITAGYGLDDADSECYVALFAEDIGAVSTTNVGVSGLTAQILYTSLATGSYDTAIAYADVITITIGGNDLMAAFYEVVAEICTASGTEMDADTVKTILSDPVTYSAQALALFNLLNTEDAVAYFGSSATFASAVAASVQYVNSIASYIKNVNADAVVLIANQYNPYRWLTGCDNIVALFESGVTAYNSALALAQTSDYTLVDVYSAFAASEDTLTNASFGFDFTTMSYYMDFDFHPNAAGHAVIAEAMAAAYDAAAGSTEEPEVTSVQVISLAVDEMTAGDQVDLTGSTIEVTYSDNSTQTLTLGENYTYGAIDSYGNYIVYYLYGYVNYEEDGDTYEYYVCCWYGNALYYEGTYIIGFEVYDSNWDEIANILTDTEITVVPLTTAVLENVTELTLNETYTSDIEENGDWVWYSYTPEVSGEYVFYSFNNDQTEYIDTYVELYVESDGELVRIGSNDDGGEGTNFLLTSSLEAGVTYYYKTRAYSSNTVGVFDVKLTEAKEITAISASSLSKTEFAQYVEDFDLSGTVVTVTYEDGTTEDIVLGESNSTLDSHGNTIYCYLLVDMGDDETWQYGYGDILDIAIGTYPVIFYTYDDEWNKISDETQSITVIPADESDAYVTIEILDQKYEANKEIESYKYSIFAFTPTETGDYYFTFGTNSGADYDSMDIDVRFVEEDEGETYLTVLNQKLYYDEEDDTWYYSYEYDEATDQNWKVYELEEGVTYYIYCYYYGTWDENWELDESLTVTVNMAAYEIGHVHSCEDEVLLWTWSDDYSSATASLRCDTCSYIYETVEATVTSTVTEATTEAEGSIVYTAAAVINGKTYTSDPVTVILEKLDESASGGSAGDTGDTGDTGNTSSTDTKDTGSNASSGGTSAGTGDVSLVGYCLILLGAAAAIVLLLKKRVNA